MSLIYGIEAIHQSPSANLPHVLGFQTARSAGDDTLFEIWNAATNAGIKAAVDLDGKYYSAALTAGDMLYAVTGGVSNVLRLDSLALGNATEVMRVNAGGTAPEYVAMTAAIVSAGTFPAGAFVFQGAVTSTGLTVNATAQITLGITGTAISTMLVANGTNTTNANGNNLSCLKVQPIFVNAGAYTSVTVKGCDIAPQFSASGSETFNLGIGLYVSSTAGGTPTVTTYRGIQIEQPGGVTSTTSTGLWIGDFTAGSTDYAIYTGAGLVRFGGNLLVDVIAEATGATGVTIDSVLLKDGLVQPGDGAVGAPAYTFASDLTTGLFRTGASAIGVALGGTQYARFTASGIMTDDILEYTGTTGVTVDSLLIKDGGVGDGTTSIDIDGTAVSLSYSGTSRVGCTSTGTTFYDDAPVILQGETRLTMDVNASTGVQDDLARTNDRSMLRFTGATTTVTGVTNGTAGELLFISAQGTVTINNDDSGSSAANRFYTKTGSALNISNGVALFVYEDTGSGALRWCEV